MMVRRGWPARPSFDASLHGFDQFRRELGIHNFHLRLHVFVET
jgi:hypothetical protein